MSRLRCNRGGRQMDRTINDNVGEAVAIMTNYQCCPGPKVAAGHCTAHLNKSNKNKSHSHDQSSKGRKKETNEVVFTLG